MSIDGNTSCSSCTATMQFDARFCPHCGASTSSSGSGGRASAGNAPIAGGLAPFTRLPTELQVIIGLLAATGALLVLACLQALPDVFDLYGETGDFAPMSRAFGSLVLIGIIYVGGVGACLLALAWQLKRADRVGRILTIAVSVIVAIGLLTAEQRTGWETVAMLCAIAIAGTLIASSRIRDLFTGELANQTDLPETVVAVRSLLMPILVLQGLTGLAMLPVGELDGKFIPIGLALIATSVVVAKFSAGLRSADTQARAAVSAAMGAYAVLALVAELEGVALVASLGFAGVVAGLLWLPEQSQRFFEPVSASSAG